jgi:polar amino acid transport system substrate-binding protein
MFASTVIELSTDQAYPPYAYKDGKEAKGVYVDIIKKAFSNIPEYDVKIKPMAWKRAVSFVKSGKVAGLFPPYYNKDRESWIKYSTPIIGETAIVFAKKQSIIDKKDFPNGYEGLTLCMNRGFGVKNFGNKKFGEMIDKKIIKLKWGNSNKICLKQVSTGKADFYLNDQLIDTKEFPDIKRGVATKSNNGYIGFTLKGNYPHLEDVRAKFNQQIELMKKNGEIDKILDNYK